MTGSSEADTVANRKPALAQPSKHENRDMPECPDDVLAALVLERDSAVRTERKLRAELDRALEELASLRQEIGLASEHDGIDLERRLANRELLLGETRAALEATHSSVSWRLTRPLRRGKRLLMWRLS